MCECCGKNAESHLVETKVGGISCGGCFGKVEKALANAPGVVSIEHLAATKEAKVIFDSRIISKERIADFLAEIGYDLV
jgi:copper chaperone CopZ